MSFRSLNIIVIIRISKILSFLIFKFIYYITSFLRNRLAWESAHAPFMSRFYKLKSVPFLSTGCNYVHWLPSIFPYAVTRLKLNLKIILSIINLKLILRAKGISLSFTNKLVINIDIFNIKGILFIISIINSFSRFWTFNFCVNINRSWWEYLR